MFIMRKMRQRTPGLLLILLALLLLAAAAPVTQAQQSTVQWSAQYFANPDFQGPAAINTIVSSLNFNWGQGAPYASLGNDNFSARYITSYYFAGGDYRFTTLADDYVRITVDNDVIIDTFADGRPDERETTVINISEGFHTVQVDYQELVDAAFLELEWTYLQPVTSPALQPVSTPWTAQYYNNANLSGFPTAILTEDSPSANWGTSSPLSSVSADNFSARWTASIPMDGTYLLEVEADDGVRVFIDGTAYIDEWHDARPETYTALFDMTAGTYPVVVEYYEGAGRAFLNFNLYQVTDQARLWNAEYYNNTSLSGSPVLTSIVADPSASWGNSAPVASLNPDAFGIRWTGTPVLTEGTYRLTVRADDGVRVYVNGDPLIDEWHGFTGETYTADVSLDTGAHTIIIEYYESGGQAFLDYNLREIAGGQPAPGSPPSQPVTDGVVTAVRLNVRGQPDTGAPIIAKVSAGDVLPVFGRNSDTTWWQVQVDGQLGWVFGRFFNVSQPAGVPVTSQAGMPDPQPTGYFATAQDIAIIRSDPSTRSAILGEIDEGDRAAIVARNSSATWWLIEYEGVVGWVSDTVVAVPPTIDLSRVPVR